MLVQPPMRHRYAPTPAPPAPSPTAPPLPPSTPSSFTLPLTGFPARDAPLAPDFTRNLIGDHHHPTVAETRWLAASIVRPRWPPYLAGIERARHHRPGLDTTPPPARAHRRTERVCAPGSSRRSARYPTDTAPAKPPDHRHGPDHERRPRTPAQRRPGPTRPKPATAKITQGTCRRYLDGNEASSNRNSPADRAARTDGTGMRAKLAPPLDALPDGYRARAAACTPPHQDLDRRIDGISRPTATSGPDREAACTPPHGTDAPRARTPVDTLRPAQAASRRRERTRRDGTAAVASGVRHQVTPATSPAGRGSAAGQAPPPNPEQRRPGPEPRRHTAHPPASSTPGHRPPAPGPARAPSSRLGNPRNTPAAGDVRPCRPAPRSRLHAALRGGSARAHHRTPRDPNDAPRDPRAPTKPVSVSRFRSASWPPARCRHRSGPQLPLWYILPPPRFLPPHVGVLVVPPNTSPSSSSPPPQ